MATSRWLNIAETRATPDAPARIVPSQFDALIPPIATTGIPQPWRQEWEV